MASLSICTITADPPGRVANVVERLRPFADEVVIAADARVDAATLTAYRALADKLFRIEYRMSERHLAWLVAQCEAEWILRFDGDELPSAAFLRRLPEILRSRDARQFWTPIVWLYPDARQALAGPPWSCDFHVRLMRNDGSPRSPGVQHHHLDVVSPREYLEEPFYHFALLTSSTEQRRDKAIRYEVARPRLLAHGGGRLNEAFYLPELRTEPPALGPVAQEDWAAIDIALAVPASPSATQAIEVGPPTDVPLVSLSEMDRYWEQRAVPDTAYRASIEPFQAVDDSAASLRMKAGEQRPLFFRVANEGSERWPASLEEKPLIRMGYRWLPPDGGAPIAEGPRSAFPRRVEPGDRVLATLTAIAPDACGEYVLEVDLVHEHERWFECGLRLPVRVVAKSDLPPAGERLHESRPPRLRRMRRVHIPAAIHRVWLGDREMPAEHVQFGETFARHHPRWEMRLWTDEDLPELGIGEAERRLARTASELSNLVRYEVLHRHGGVYVDTDFECLRPLGGLLRGARAFTALETPGRAATAILGSVPGHPLFERASRLARLTLGLGAHSADACGPYFFTLLAEQEPDLTIFGAKLFYPYLWDEPERRHEVFPEAYAVHHWARSWWGQ